MTAVAKQIVLPADIYDALELSALAFNGIGHGRFDDGGDDDGTLCPRCVHGHAMFADNNASGAPSDLTDALWRAGLTYGTNDMIVGQGERISWDEYCRRGNIVRGEDQ